MPDTVLFEPLVFNVPFDEPIDSALSVVNAVESFNVPPSKVTLPLPRLLSLEIDMVPPKTLVPLL